MKGKALRKHSLHEKTPAEVLLKLCTRLVTFDKKMIPLKPSLMFFFYFNKGIKASVEIKCVHVYFAFGTPIDIAEAIAQNKLLKSNSITIHYKTVLTVTWSLICSAHKTIPLICRSVVLVHFPLRCFDDL